MEGAFLGLILGLGFGAGFGDRWYGYGFELWGYVLLVSEFEFYFIMRGGAVD